MKASGLLRAHWTSPDLAWFLHRPHLLPVSPRSGCTCCIVSQTCQLRFCPRSLAPILCQALSPKSPHGSLPPLLLQVCSNVSFSMRPFLTPFKTAPSYPIRGTPISLPCFISPHSTYLFVLEFISPLYIGSHEPVLCHLHWLPATCTLSVPWVGQPSRGHRIWAHLHPPPIPIPAAGGCPGIDGTPGAARGFFSPKQGSCPLGTE